MNNSDFEKHLCGCFMAGQLKGTLWVMGWDYASAKRYNTHKSVLQDMRRKMKDLNGILRLYNAKIEAIRQKPE